MRIALVTDAVFAGLGHEPAAETTRQVADQLVLVGHEALLLSGDPGPASLRGARVTSLRPADLGHTTGVLADFGADLVHVVEPRLLGTVALRATRHLGLPVVVSHHSTRSGPLGGFWSARVHPRVGRTLVTCADAERRLAAVGIGAHRWAPGTDPTLYAEDRRCAALHDRWARTGKPDGPRLVVGQLGPVDSASSRRRLAAIARVPGTRVVVLGGGRQTAKLRASSPRVVVLDPMPALDTAQALASLDVLVQVRRKTLDCHEARAALASAIPVVGADKGGLPEVVHDGLTGLLVDPADDAAVARGVARLVADPDLRLRLAARARPSVVDRTWEVAVTELVDIHYAAVLRPRAAIA